MRRSSYKPSYHSKNFKVPQQTLCQRLCSCKGKQRRLTRPEIEQLIEDDEENIHQAAVCEMQILPLLRNVIDEADLVDVLVQRPCKKNPGHPTFIPIRDFQERHLPIEARNRNMWNIIKDQSLRTVKLTVYYTTDRPAKFDVGVPAGSRRGRFGTGWIELFDKNFKNLSGYREGKTFVISTAAHVVFDKLECKETKIEFFFESDSEREEVLEARGLRIVLVNSSLDVCRFMCRAKDTLTGAMINEKLQFIPKWYPPVPPIENIAWCISHPHGMAQRVTIGRVTEITNEEPTWSVNVLKLLVFQCCLLNYIPDKKVYYVFFRDSVNGINLYLADDIDEETRTKYKHELLKHLVDKGMIARPTETDARFIKKTYNELTSYLTKARDFEFREKWEGSEQEMSPARLKEEKHHIFKLVVQDEARRVPTVAKFHEKFNDIEKELWSKKHEILFGNKVQKANVSRTKSIIYSLDSCPGSSGARVTAYVMTNEGLRRFMGHHSRGLKENQGNMCGGGGSRLVPTTPLPAELKKKYNIKSILLTNPFQRVTDTFRNDEDKLSYSSSLGFGNR